MNTIVNYIVFIFLCIILYRCNSFNNSNKSNEIAEKKSIATKDVFFDRKIKYNKDSLIYSDTSLNVFVDENISFIDSIKFYSNYRSKYMVYNLFQYNEAPCSISNDSLKFIISNAIINNNTCYSLTTYFISLYNQKFNHANYYSVDVVVDLSEANNARDKIDLILNKGHFEINDTMKGILIRYNNIDYLKENEYKFDTICFKYLVNNDNIVNNVLTKIINYKINF